MVSGVQSAELLPVEMFSGWCLLLCVQIPFSGAGGIDTIGRAKLLELLEPR